MQPVQLKDRMYLWKKTPTMFVLYGMYRPPAPQNLQLHTLPLYTYLYTTYIVSRLLEAFLIGVCYMPCFVFEVEPAWTCKY